MDVVCVSAELGAGTGFEELVGRMEEEEPEMPGLKGLEVGLIGSLYSEFYFISFSSAVWEWVWLWL